MTTILFVHGTGTRKEVFDSSLSQIRKGVAEEAIGDAVEGVFWGARREHLDTVRLKSAPSLETHVNEDRAQSALWNLLVVDPLAEVRVTPTRAARWTGTTVNWTVLVNSLRFDQTPFTDSWVPAAFVPHLRDAVAWLIKTAEFRTAAASQPPDRGAFAETVSRALVAKSGSACGEEGRGVLQDARQVFTGAIAKDLWPDEYGGVIAKVVGMTISPLATQILLNNRSMMNFGIARMIGDILAYQADPEGPATSLGRKLGELGPDVTVVAHSLGAIIAFEHLIRQRPSNVKHFISVGTQIGLFHELGALGSNPLSGTSSGKFPRWLNIYDPVDFLSYLARAVLPTLCERDAPVDNRLPFPASHSGYWSNSQVWKTIKSWLAH